MPLPTLPDGCPTCGALPCDWTDRPSPAAYAVQDILAALEAICAEAERMSMTMRRRAIFNEGRAAIAKALGRTPNEIGDEG